MRINFIISLVLLAGFLSANFGVSSPQQTRSSKFSSSATQLPIAALDISKLTRAQVERVKSKPEFKWWSEFGDTLVVSADTMTIEESLRTENLPIIGRWFGLSPDMLEVAVAAHSQEIPLGRKLLVKSGRLSLLARSPSSKDDALLPSWHFKITPFVANTVYVSSGSIDGRPKIWGQAQFIRAKNIMADVDPVRWYLDVGTLTNWNRHVSSVDIVSARDWIKNEFDQLKPSSLNLQKFNVMGRDAWNVIATFDAGPTSDIYIICGHYDSISERPSELAPGAEDNATGAAAVIELARVFSKYPKSATLVFATFSGEEQGLVGSKAFVRNLDPATRSRIKAVLNMDMIGYSKDDSEDVLLESSSRYKNLVDQFAAAASLVDGLKYYVTFNPYGSDHMPFIEAGIPAILTIDNDWGDYPSYHRSSDTIDKVSRDMGAAILRMNAGALAGMLD
jgi:hypothetical protein